MNTKLNDFQKDKSEGKSFWLGPIVNAFTIAEYQFLEYSELSFAIGDKYKTLTGRTYFTTYINGKGTRHSHDSLDAALVGVISYKHEGPNGRASDYFMKMISEPGSAARV